MPTPPVACRVHYRVHVPIDYPRAGRQGLSRFIPSWKLVLGSLLTLGLAAVVVGALAFALAWFTTDIPEESEVAVAQTSIVYWNDGNSELARLGDTNRISVPLSDVPEHVRYAVLAAEDRTFYQHHGFAVTGFLRALWTNLTTGSSQGGSTITQQYAKNAFLSAEKTYVRKFKELVLSSKLEAQLSKDEILQRYLNTIFFGRGAYGIQTAAEAYFDTDAQDLTLEQGAVLAAIINAPGQFNPDSNLERLQGRYAYVLEGMADEGWVTPAERDAALDAFPEIAERRANQKFGGPNGYLLRMVQDEVLSMGFTEAEVEGGGLRIVSTFDRRAQRSAVAAVKDQGPRTGTDGLRIGLAAVEPVTGEVVAIYGGADYLENQLNNATQAISQAGSTFKPFGLAAAVEEGIGLDSLWPGNSPHTVGGWDVVNYADNSYGELITLLKGTEQSVNTVYVELTNAVGVDRVRDSALRAGQPQDPPGWGGDDHRTVVLGTASPHTIDVANAYATFASRGQRAGPTVIRRVGTAEGGLLYERENEPQRAFDENVCDVVNSALQSVVRNGTGSPAAALGRPAAAKTGSTDSYLSAWFAGYTPQLAAAVSFSKDDVEGNPISLSGTGGMSAFYGSGYPARVWTAFMRGALEGAPVLAFEEPSNPPSGGGMSPTPTEPAEPSGTPSEPVPTESVAPTESAAPTEPSAPATAPATSPPVETPPAGPSPEATATAATQPAAQPGPGSASRTSERPADPTDGSVVAQPDPQSLAGSAVGAPSPAVAEVSAPVA